MINQKAKNILLKIVDLLEQLLWKSEGLSMRDFFGKI
jgi:hypothetical protein